MSGTAASPLRDSPTRDSPGSSGGTRGDRQSDSPVRGRLRPAQLDERGWLGKKGYRLSPMLWLNSHFLGF
jgi:hypothetical protein